MHEHICVHCQLDTKSTIFCAFVSFAARFYLFDEIVTLIACYTRNITQDNKNRWWQRYMVTIQS